MCHFEDFLFDSLMVLVTLLSRSDCINTLFCIPIKSRHIFSQYLVSDIRFDFEKHISVFYIEFAYSLSVPLSNSIISALFVTLIVQVELG